MSGILSVHGLLDQFLARFVLLYFCLFYLLNNKLLMLLWIIILVTDVCIVICIRLLIHLILALLRAFLGVPDLDQSLAAFDRYSIATQDPQVDAVLVSILAYQLLLNVRA